MRAASPDCSRRVQARGEKGGRSSGTRLFLLRVCPGQTLPRRPARSLLLDDVALQSCDEVEKLLLLLSADLELVERGDEVLGRSVPLGLRDAQPLVRVLHRAPGVDAGAARRGAELVEYVLAYALLRVGAVADEEALELLVRDEPTDEVVNDRRDCVVAAEPLVERLLRLLLRCRQRRRGPRHHDRAGEDGERSPQGHSSHVHCLLLKTVFVIDADRQVPRALHVGLYALQSRHRFSGLRNENADGGWADWETGRQKPRRRTSPRPPFCPSPRLYNPQSEFCNRHG